MSSADDFRTSNGSSRAGDPVDGLGRPDQEAVPAWAGAPRRRPGGRLDPMAQLRALRESTADIARKTGAREPAPAGAGDHPATAPLGRVTSATAPPRSAAPVPSAQSGATAVGIDPRFADPDSRIVAQPTPPPEHARRGPRVRKARLRLLRLDPWSVMKVSLLLSVAAGITLVVAVAALWSILDAAGVFTTLGDLVREVTQSEQSLGISIEDIVALPRVLGFTTLVAVVDVVLVTALATLGAFIYNLAASLLGGLELTLAEDD